MGYMVVLESETFDGECWVKTMTYNDVTEDELVSYALKLAMREKEMFDDVTRVLWRAGEVVVGRGDEAVDVDVSGCLAVIVGNYETRGSTVSYPETNYLVTTCTELSEVSSKDPVGDLLRDVSETDEGAVLTERYGYVVREETSGTVDFD